MNMDAARSVVVTGASSGIGKASAFALLEAGFQVFAGVRSEQAGLQLREEAPAGAEGRLTALRLDVTDDAQVRAAVGQIAAAVGPRGLWGLFNNAGISVAAPLEFVTTDDLRRQLEVNVVGQHAVTRAFIPLLRIARGRILTTGYNGPPAGISHCTPETCLRTKYNVPSGERQELCRGLHAEQNAIIQAAAHGISIQGAMLFCTTLPCSICLKMLINAGIHDIVYDDGYADELTQDFLREADIRIKRFQPQGEGS